MTKKILHCHPLASNHSVQSLTADIDRSPDGGLMLRYRLEGDLTKILIPQAKPPSANDGLWLHTCFEAFVAHETADYYEFNFSPSGEWAAYGFDGYRERTSWSIGRPPAVEVSQELHQLLLTARIAPADLPAAGRLQLGLSAVIESADGALSYWALHHPGERPDFHDRAGFVHSL